MDLGEGRYVIANSNATKAAGEWIEAELETGYEVESVDMNNGKITVITKPAE